MIVVTSGTRKERKYAPTVTKTMMYKPVIEAEPKDEILLAKSSRDYPNSTNQRDNCVSLITQKSTPFSNTGLSGLSLDTTQ